MGIVGLPLYEVVPNRVVAQPLLTATFASKGKWDTQSVIDLSKVKFPFQFQVTEEPGSSFGAATNLRFCLA